MRVASPRSVADIALFAESIARLTTAALLINCVPFRWLVNVESGRVGTRIECNDEVLEETTPAKNGPDRHLRGKAGRDVDHICAKSQRNIVKIDVDRLTRHNPARHGVNAARDVQSESEADICAKQRVG